MSLTVQITLLYTLSRYNILCLFGLLHLSAAENSQNENSIIISLFSWIFITEYLMRIMLLNGNKIYNVTFIIRREFWNKNAKIKQQLKNKIGNIKNKTIFILKNLINREEKMLNKNLNHIKSNLHINSNLLTSRKNQKKHPNILNMLKIWKHKLI